MFLWDKKVPQRSTAGGGWVKCRILRLQATSQSSSSSFCGASLELPRALESPSCSGTQAENLSFSGAAGEACGRAEVPAVRALSWLAAHLVGEQDLAACCLCSMCSTGGSGLSLSLRLLHKLEGKGSHLQSRARKGAWSPCISALCL